MRAESSASTHFGSFPLATIARKPQQRSVPRQITHRISRRTIGLSYWRPDRLMPELIQIVVRFAAPGQMMRTPGVASRLAR